MDVQQSDTDRREKMNREQLIIGIQELIDDTFNKQGHAVWINGQAVALKDFVVMFEHIESVRAYAEDKLRELGKEERK